MKATIWLALKTIVVALFSQQKHSNGKVLSSRVPQPWPPSQPLIHSHDIFSSCFFLLTVFLLRLNWHWTSVQRQFWEPFYVENYCKMNSSLFFFVFFACFFHLKRWEHQHDRKSFTYWCDKEWNGDVYLLQLQHPEMHSSIQVTD